MQDSAAPAKIPLPFANNAGGAYIENIPTASQIGITNGAASFYDGFPPDNFLPFASGGAGPFGKDFNGLLYQVTGGLQWLEAGAPFVYDGTFSTAIGGYPKGAQVPTAGLDGSFWLSTVDNNTSDPETGGANWLLVRAQGFYAVDTGTANALVITLPPAITSLAQLTGVPITIKKASNGTTPNSGPVTLVPNGLTATAVEHTSTSFGGGPLIAGELPPLGILVVVYDGTVFQLISDSNLAQVGHGGTGLPNVAIGNVLYGTGTASLGTAAPGGSGVPLVSQGPASAPAFGGIDLHVGVLSGSKLPYASIPLQLLTYQTASSATFTVPAEVYLLFMEVVGGGGGGASGNATNSGGGGGAGGYACGWTGVVPGDVITYSVGAGGPGGTAGGDGGGGSSTSFGPYLSATGGTGGTSVANAAGGSPGIGSTGAVGSANGFALIGGWGGDGNPTANAGPGGTGGASFFGGGVRGATGGLTLDAAPGAGGGGSYGSGGAVAGSFGVTGFLIVWG